jgi:hypothetical protein
MMGYGNSVNSKFMEAYLGGGVATSNDSTSSMSSMISPSPNNWLSWGKIMPVDPLATTSTTGGIDIMGGMGGMGVMGGMDGFGGMTGLGGS